MSSNLSREEDWFTYYVASPYSHPEEKWRRERYEVAVKAAKTLSRLGYSAFVPIAYDGLWDLDPTFTVDHSWTFWEKIDLPLLNNCSALVLLEIPGWKESRGVAGELEHCVQTGKPVMCLSLEDLQDDDAIKRKMAILQMMIKVRKGTHKDSLTIP